MKIFTTFKVFLFLLLAGLAAQGQNYNVTFKVDMSQYVGLSDTVYVNGTWNSWCGRCNPLVKQGSTNVWEGTYLVPSGAQEFKFTIGGWNAQETLSSGSPCTVTNSGFTNRSITVTAATVLPVVCWQSCLACTNQLPMNLPVNFDSTNINYVLTDFGGNASVVATDPVVSTNKVAKVTKSNVAELWAGTTLGTSGFVNAIPFAANANKITMRVYSPDSGIAIRLKAEDATDGSKSVETETRTTVANAWQTLEFNFANQASGTAAINYTYTYKKLSAFFNFGVTGATAGTKIYYFDDVNFVAPSGPILLQVKLPINYDSSNVNYTMTDFGGNASSIVADPMNAANKVGKVIKSNTAELWAGTTLSTSAGLAEAIPFTSTNAKMKVRIYSPDSGIAIRLKAEDPTDPTKSVETEARTTVANAWADLEFNFANQASGTAAINYGYTYKMVTIFFNFGTTGATAGNKTYYFDDVRYAGTTAPVLSQIKLPINFDATDVNYTMTDFGGNASSIVADPMNAANKVGKVIKSNVAELWAGTTCGTAAGLAEAIPFSAGKTKLSVRVYSPDSGIAIRLKAEDPLDNTKSVETEARTTVANAWSTLEFNFANQASGTAPINYAYTYRMLSIFFNFGTTGATAGNKTYYFDDVQVAGITPPPPANKVKVVFSVDAKNIPMNAGDTVTLNGTFNAWCGACTKLSNVPGTKIWTGAVDLDTAMEYEYKFTIGNWVVQENLAPTLPCTKTTGNFTNRVYRTGKTNDSLGLVCWESCNTCTNATPKTKVTFNVNMKDYTGDISKGVTLNGSFNGWCGNCTPMTLVGNKIYSATVNLDTGAYEFKYTIGNWDDQEQFTPADLCTKTTGNFTNRYMEVKDTAAMTIGAYCWNTCTICNAVGLEEKLLSEVKLYPNPASDMLNIDFGKGSESSTQVMVYNMLGELVSEKSAFKGTGIVNMDIHSLKPGIYVVKIEMDKAVRTYKLRVD